MHVGSLHPSNRTHATKSCDTSFDGFMSPGVTEKVAQTRSAPPGRRWQHSPCGSGSGLSVHPYPSSLARTPPMRRSTQAALLPRPGITGPLRPHEGPVTPGEAHNVRAAALRHRLVAELPAVPLLRPVLLHGALQQPLIGLGALPIRTLYPQRPEPPKSSSRPSLAALLRPSDPASTRSAPRNPGLFFLGSWLVPHPPGSGTHCQRS
jgi:hypothetical protein